MLHQVVTPQRPEDLMTWSLGLLIGLMFAALGTHAEAHPAGTDHETSAALRTFLQSVDPQAVLQPGGVLDCKLSGGTQTQCMKFTLQAAPKRTPGPWCPDHIGDGSEAGGFWIADGKVFDVDGAFVKNLAMLYKNSKWKLYDPKTGAIKVTRSFDACFAAARPDVPLEYYDYCTQCDVDQVVAPPSANFFIPLKPVIADSPAPLRDQPGAGVALNGVRLNGPAPYDDIVKARNIAPFDDCGGHVNPYHGYHYHFVTDCLETVSPVDGHAPQIGIAIDGYGVFRWLDGLGKEAQGLDACRGHKSDELGYHYHAAPVGTNSIIGCITGEFGCVSPPGTASCDATAVRQPVAAPGAPPPPGAGPPREKH